MNSTQTIAVLTLLSMATTARAWEIRYSDPDSVLLDQNTVVMITHASSHFDPLKATQPAIARVLNAFRSLNVPIVCFHDKNNPENPPEKYLYNDWHQLTIVNSGIGHYDFDMSAVRHVICLGGYFWCCERHTVIDTLKHWRRDAPDHDLRITQIVDGVFDMAEGVPEPVVQQVRAFQRDNVWARHPKAALTVEQTLALINDDEHAVEFLKRQLPEFPEDVNVTLDYFGERIPVVTESDHATNSDRERDGDRDDGTDGDLFRRRRPELILAFRCSRDLQPRRPSWTPQRPSRNALDVLSPPIEDDDVADLDSPAPTNNR